MLTVLYYIISTAGGYISTDILFYLILFYLNTSSLLSVFYKVLSTILAIPGLHEDNDQTAWLPISRNLPSFSSW